MTEVTFSKKFTIPKIAIIYNSELKGTTRNYTSSVGEAEQLILKEAKEDPYLWFATIAEVKEVACFTPNPKFNRGKN